MDPSKIAIQPVVIPFVAFAVTNSRGCSCGGKCTFGLDFTLPVSMVESGQPAMINRSNWSRFVALHIRCHAGTVSQDVYEVRATSTIFSAKVVCAFDITLVCCLKGRMKIQPSGHELRGRD